MAGVPREQSVEGYGRTWLIVAEGGWWKASEVRASTGEGIEAVQQRLSNMTAQNYLEQRLIPKHARKPGESGRWPERMEYAVTAACLVPRGLTTAQVSAALGMRAHKEAA